MRENNQVVSAFRRTFGRLKPATTGIALALAACATNPATGQRQLSFMSEEKEIALGHENGHVTARHAASQYSKSVLSQIGLIAAAVAAPGGDLIAQGGGTGLGL